MTVNDTSDMTHNKTGTLCHFCIRPKLALLGLSAQTPKEPSITKKTTKPHKPQPYQLPKKKQ
jgi:hypothetical protein